MREAVLTVDDAGFAAMGLEGLLEHCREAGIREFEELACHGDGAVVLLTVESPLGPDRLAALECVDEFERVGDGETHEYVVAFSAPDAPEGFGEHADDLVGNCDPELDERGATLSLVGSQGTIRDAIGEYETAGASPDLRKLGPYEGSDHPLDALTDRQREVIRTAFEMGYYEVPREASTGDVAAELGVDDSTVTEHLQRAERNLLGQLLSDDG